jgi:D-alanyl-D-alanine carboxypeptidase (penicillin-binding protein 5/6)
MGDWRRIAGMASTVLATPIVMLPVVMLPVVVLPAVPVPAQPAPPSGEVAEVPCPVAELDPAPRRPPQPTPPPHRPGDLVLGGEALASGGLVVPPGAGPLPEGLTATSWLVADLDTGVVLGGCGPHRHELPASTLKLLLAAALLPELDPDQAVRVTRADLAIEPGSSAVGLVAGGEYRVETLWLGLLLNSGNDAANVLARVGGGEAGLAGGLRAMNQTARRLGAYQTSAATASGLDGPGQFTSAYDLALIARELFDRADFGRYIATERAGIPGQPELDAAGFQIQNQNDLLSRYPGALGGKTGFTELARHSFVGAAERDRRRLVVTLLGAEARPLPSWQQAAALLDWGFALPAGTRVGRLVEPGELADRAVSSTRAPDRPAPVGQPSSVPSPGPSPGPGLPVRVGPVVLAGAALAVAAPLALVAVLRGGRRRRRRSGTVRRRSGTVTR